MSEGICAKSHYDRKHDDTNAAEDNELLPIDRLDWIYVRHNS